MENEHDKNMAKEEWKKNENKIRFRLLLLLFAVLLLVVILIFYNSFIWIIIINIATVVGLAADLVYLRKEMGKNK